LFSLPPHLPSLLPCFLGPIALLNRAIATFLSFQHPTGGFAGGPGQIPHLLPTYAAVCSLAILNGGWEEINREALLAFFLRMKRPDGSFTVCDGGEVDVRCV
jgi:protein farnesyltransferase subunit beta